MRKLLLIMSFVIAFCTGLNAQKTSLTGTVTGDDGLPIPGASVIVKGTTIGTVTNLDGQYTLQVPADATTLVFTFIGMAQQEQPIDGRKVIDVRLSNDEQLVDEVMVVAYGTAKRSSFTGSAGTVKSEKLAERSVSNAMQALTGQVAGVQVLNSNGAPGSAPTIRIRGIGSMSASNAPLYVVDGVPYEGSVSAINPQDIESMTVLKDAAASAIYGARGANGVVLITTKRAKQGDAVVNVEAKWGNNQRGVPNYDVMDDPAMYLETQYRALYNSRALNGSSIAAAHDYANANLVESLGYQIYTVPEGERLIGTNFKLNPNATLGYYDGEYYYTPDDWYDEMFDKSNLRQEYNVSTSGSTDRLNYYMSFGYLDDTGIVNNTGFTRYTSRVKGDLQAKEWLKMGANLAYTFYNRKTSSTLTTWGSSGNAFYVANMIAPIYPMYYRDKDGNIMYDENGIKRYDFGSKRAFMNGSNPAADFALNDRNRETDNFNGKWYVDVTPIEGLTLTATLGAGVINQRYNGYTNPRYGSGVGAGGYVSVSHTRDFSLNQQYLATYKKTFSEVNNVDVLFGYESFRFKDQYLGASNSNMYNPNVGEISNTVNEIPSASSSVNYYSTEGILARLQYDYAGKYFLSGSYRRDASSCFHPDNRWGNFGSAGAAWLMSEEDFVKNIKWINMLKVKASYGVQGNDNLGRDDVDSEYATWAYKPYLDSYKVSYSGDAGSPFTTTFIKKGNKDITWETSYSLNVGADFELFGNRLGGVVEYFYRKTTDLLYSQPVPNVLGYSSIPMNIGDIVNKGVEIDLHATVFKNSDIEWTVSFNATHFTNEITEMAETAKANGGIKGSTYIYRVGGSLYNSYLRRFAGVDKTNGQALYYVDPDNGDFSTTSSYTSATQSDLGSTLPDVYGGFGTEVRAYGFDLSASFSYQLGGKIYDGTYDDLMHCGQPSTAGTNWHKDILKSWSPENPNSNIPRLCSSDDRRQTTNDRFLVKSDYLSFNNVVLGYTLPQELTRKLFVERLRIYASCDNVALIACRKGLDPRQRMGTGDTTTSGNYNYSALRTISGGVQITF